jgi:hypothetical protein
VILSLQPSKQEIQEIDNFYIEKLESILEREIILMKKSYGRFKSDSAKYNSLAIRIGDLILYYSYNTIIAFYHPSTNTVIMENCRNNTTGRHLNLIDTTTKRLPRAEFEKKLKKILKPKYF